MNEIWVDAATEKEYAGGCWITTAAPLERIPLFLRKGANLKTGNFPLNENHLCSLHQ